MNFEQELLKVAGALVVVLALLFVGLFWARRTFGEIGGRNGEPAMRLLGGLRVGTGKQIMLVEIAGEILVLGATARELTLLTCINDEQRVARLRSVVHPMAQGLDSWLRNWKGGTSSTKLVSHMGKDSDK